MLPDISDERDSSAHMMSGHAALICNPRSGTLSKMPDAAAALEAAIEAAGFTLMVRPGHDLPLEEQWEQARLAGARTVFAAGGDGTLRAIAALALRDGVTLGLLPGGTMNRVCARLGLTADPVTCVGQFTPGDERTLDVGMVNGEVFLFQSLLGAPARLLRFREMQRGEGLLGWLPLVRMAWRKLRALRVGRVRLSLGDGERLQGSAAVITLPEPEAPTLLSVGVTNQVSTFRRLGQALSWFRGRLADSPDAEVRLTNRLAAFSRRSWMRISLDGEMLLLAPPLRYRLIPGGLRILSPRS